MMATVTLLYFASLRDAAGMVGFPSPGTLVDWELGEEFLAVLHRGVVGLVGAEVAPDGLQFAGGLAGIDGDGDGKRIGGGGGRARGEQDAEQRGFHRAEGGAHSSTRTKPPCE